MSHTDNSQASSDRLRHSPTNSAKLRPPTSAQALIARVRLLRLLDETSHGGISLVVAPAGSGKTSLLATWVEHSSLPTTWLSLDESDRDYVQLWMGILAALERVAPGCSARASTYLRRVHDRGLVVPTLIDDLHAADAPPSALIIDDVHEIDDDLQIASSLATFLQSLPPWLHVLASSRRRLQLPVDRLRARGSLGEVGFAELKFSQGEAEDLVHRLVPQLNDAEVKAAAEHAGGWAASIRLTALAARSNSARPVPTHPEEGTQQLLADYLWNELLANERPDIVDTLQSISVVERANGSLAAVLSGRADADLLLQEAEQRGLFVSRVAGTGWFELQSLVREVLSTSLDEQRSRALNARAAQWFEDHAEHTLALEHWGKAGDSREALRLLASTHARLYDQGREEVIGRVLKMLDLSVSTDDIPTMTEYAWCHLLVDRHRFIELVGTLSKWVRKSPDVEVLVAARVSMLESVACTMRGDWVGGAQIARTALTAYGPQWWKDPIGRFGWNMVARDLAMSERWDDLEEDMTEVVTSLSVDPQRRVAFEGTRALGEALAGRPLAALRVADEVKEVAEVANMTILRSELTLAEAIAHRELGDRVRSTVELLELSRIANEPTPYVVVVALLQLVGAQLDGGDLAAASLAFGEAEDLVRTECPGTGTTDLLGQTGALLALTRGQPDDARHWAQSIRDPFWAGVSSARILLAEDEQDLARKTLETLIPRCVRHVVIRNLLLARSATTPEEAMEHVVDAIEPASVHGLIQTIASEGSETVQLVELAAWRVPQLWLDRLRRAAVPDLDPAMHEAPRLVESLTDREREVLRLLPSRLTLKEIAAELQISVNTLKFHLKVIYRKLECGSRAEAAQIGMALARARRVGHSSSGSNGHGAGR